MRSGEDPLGVGRLPEVLLVAPFGHGGVVGGERVVDAPEQEVVDRGEQQVGAALPERCDLEERAHGCVASRPSQIRW